MLRKQPLIIGWFSHVETLGSSIWFGTANAFIHSCMYCYYALRAMRINPPKWIAMTLTTLQIAQMILGIVITISIYYYVQITQLQCNVTIFNLKISALIYISYLVLFVNYFKQTYLSDRIGKKNHFQSDSSIKIEIVKSFLLVLTKSHSTKTIIVTTSCRNKQSSFFLFLKILRSNFY